MDGLRSRVLSRSANVCFSSKKVLSLIISKVRLAPFGDLGHRLALYPLTGITVDRINFCDATFDAIIGKVLSNFECFKQLSMRAHGFSR